MKLDGTQFTHRSYKHYTGVLKQQGRVDLDADWNEYVDIQKHLGRTEAKDVIGPCGAPKRGGGFKIDVAPDHKDLTISSGRIYVGGILCELEATPVPFDRTGDDVVQVQNLVVDGRRFEEGHWVELIAEGSTNTKLIQVTKVGTGKRLTLDSSVEDHFTHLRRITTYNAQPDYPNSDLPETGRADGDLYLLYLDVWQRHISALEDADIQEVALGGPDTATRTKTVWQVKHKKIEDPDGVDCSRFGRDWTPKGTSIPPVMAARAEPAPVSDNPCDIPPGAGYRGLENRLYRVEIHSAGKLYGWPRPSSVASTTVTIIDANTIRVSEQHWKLEERPWQTGQVVELFSNDTDASNRAGILARITHVQEAENKLKLDADVSRMVGQSGLKVRRVATFKWSRDNGSVAFSVDDFITDQQVKVKRLGRDQVLGLHPGDWVEVMGDATELRGEAGTLARIVPDGIDQSERKISLSENVSAHEDEEHPKVRRWDSNGAVAVEVPIEVPGNRDGWLGLEDGVQVKFDLNSTYETGDYWLIPARAVKRDVLWPRDEPNFEPLFEARHGTGHQYCALALVKLDEGGWVSTPQDCRPLFPPLTEIEVGGCCIRVAPGESIQQAIDTVIRAGGGCICLGTGVHRISGSLRLRDAHNLALHGESMSSVLFMNGTDDEDFGGLLVLENCAHVSIEDLFIVGTDVSALVEVRAGSEYSHTVALRGLTMLNMSESEERPDLTCAIRLADVYNVLIEDSRLLADVGVLGLNGERLPEISRAREARSDSTEQPTVDFEDLRLGREFEVGDAFTVPGVEIEAQPLRMSDESVREGFAKVVEAGERVGAAGRQIEVNNASLGFVFDNPTPELSLSFEHPAGEELNITINNEPQRFSDFSEIDGQTIGGVAVSVAEVEPGSAQGALTLTGIIDSIESFAIGGSRLRIGDVAFSQQSVPMTEPGGVRDLRMKDVKVRYRTFGTWTVTAKDWLIEHCDFRPLDLSITETPTAEGAEVPFGGSVLFGGASAAAPPEASTLRELRSDLLEDGLSQAEARQLLQRVDDTLSQEGHVNAGTAIKAFSWRNCTINTTHLQGAVGLFAWWWMRGAATDNAIRAREAGIFAAWAHEARWNDNRLRVTGIALAFVGSYRTRIEDNHVRASTGLTNIPILRAVGGLREYLREVARNYATPNADIVASEQAVLWMLLEEVVRLLDLSELKQSAQAVLDATEFNGVPVLALAARALHGVLSNFEGRTELESSVPAPIIALLLEGNDIEGSDRCISLDNFISLGGLRVIENRLHTIVGQALRIEVSPYAVSVPVVIALWWAVFRVVIRGAANLIYSVRNADISSNLKEALVAFLEQLSTLLGWWSSRSESFLESDLRVEENTIRSLDTAIESNLFDLTIRHNHITLQEHSVPNRDAETIISTLDESDALRPLAVAMREGASADIGRGMNLLGDEALIDNRETRSEVAEALANIGSSVSESSVKDASINLGDAFARQNVTAVRERLPRFIEALQGMAHTHGIWLKGAGGSIVGNRVLVPPDIDPDSWARGGILLGTDRNSADWLVVLNMLKQIREDPDIFSEPLALLGARKTLIEGNEVAGGVDHGISVREMILGLPEALDRRVQKTIDFEDLGRFDFDGAGGPFSTSGITVTPRPFQPDDGASRSGGGATTDEGRAGGSGMEMRLHNINLSFDFGGPVTPELSLRFGHFPDRGNLNIEINGELRTIGRFSEIGGQWIGGVEVCRVQVTEEAGEAEEAFAHGELTLCGTIHSFAIGGERLWIDDITFSRLVDTTRGIFDLKVSNNRVHDMAGAGIFLDEEALAVGVDIEDNHVTDCSGIAALASLTDAKGGLVIRNAALCRVRGNRISHCGNFAIDLDTVYDLTLADNHILQNEPNGAITGAMQLREVYGSAGIRNNDILLNCFWGLLASNEEGPSRLPPPLVDLLDAYMRLHRDNRSFVPSQQIHATLLGNRLQVLAEIAVPLDLSNLDNLSFTGNHITSEVGVDYALSYVQLIGEGLLANNLLDGQEWLRVFDMQHGVISGNVSPSNIPIQLFNSRAVQDGLNVPPVQRFP
jgi:hypothetical protein